MALKVVSYNLNRTDKAEALRAFLREIERADVYCFQLISREVLGAVKEELGYAYADIFAGTGDGFGLASVTRLPVRVRAWAGDPSIAKEHREAEGNLGEIPRKKDGSVAWYKMLKNDLFQACKWRGLSTEGTNLDMQKRLSQFLDDHPEGARKDSSGSSSPST